MHFHLPRPLHGWRALAGEVGIIVLGVLIALGAGQLVETIHARSEVAQFRSAVDVELSNNLAAYRYRIEQEPCVKRRLAELREWMDADAGNHPVPTGEIGRPSIYSFLSSTWKSSSTDVMNHLSLEAREHYAALYDFAGLIDDQLGQEEEIWRSLNAFNYVSHLSADDRRKIRDLTYRSKSVDALVTENYPWFVHDAAAMGITPQWRDRGKFVTPPDPEFCRALFRPKAAG
jgi:hypothetical protein